jgi:hypothetical protein
MASLAVSVVFSAFAAGRVWHGLRITSKIDE